VTRVNLSKPADYYSQRNNRIRPLETCAPTSMIDALVASGIALPETDDEQPEDALTHFLEHDPRVIDFYRNNDQAWIREFYAAGRPPNEIHPVLAYGTNLWLGRPDLVRFTWSATVTGIAIALRRGSAVVVSGEWPCAMRDGSIKEIGHVVAVVGFETAQDTVREDPHLDGELISAFIIDDPYGDYRTLYRERRGDDVVCSLADFKAYTKTRFQSEAKLAHFIGC